MPFKTVPELYTVWQSMLDRCRNVNRRQWKDYGGRGIAVCDRWHVFANFVADMGPRPTTKHTLDRLDNDGNYTPKNCRWATRKEQQRNQVLTRRVTIEGIEYIAVDLAQQFGIKTDTIVERAKQGLTFKAVTTRGYMGWNSGRPKDTCKNGHPYTPENTRLLGNGKRACRECLRAGAQARYWASRA